MPSSTSNSDRSVDAVERLVLRRWWVFPLLGLVIALAASKWFWYGVTLDAADIASGWPNPFKGAYLLVVGAFSIVPLAWAVLHRFEVAAPWLRRIPAAPLAAVLLVMGLDIAVRSPRFQAPFWLAVRARAGAGDHFMRELTYLRLHRHSPAARERVSAVYLVGSSQVLVGIDEELLAALIEPTPVRRRAMYGMTPLKALSAVSFFDIEPGDTVLFYLSEFDFTNQLEMPTNWMRPLSSARTVGLVARCFHRFHVLRNWRQFIDLGMASVSELWRMRDYIRHVVFHLCGDAHTRAAAGIVNLDGAGEFAEPGSELHFMPAEFRAFRRLVEELKERGAGIVVFEGRVNPEMHTARRDSFREETASRLQVLSERMGFVFVPAGEQAFRPAPEHWKDMTHLSDEGRREFTTYLSGYLNVMHAERAGREADPR